MPSPAANYAITAYNSSGSGTATLNLTVSNLAAAPNITYTTLPIYTTGTAITSLTPVNSGGAVPANVYAQVTTFAGSATAGKADGTGTAATFNYPGASVIDVSGNIYVVDQSYRIIRKITPAGVVTTFAGSGAAGSVNGTGTAATFNYIAGLAIDASGNLYVADQYNNMIRKITSAGVVTTLAGNTISGFANGTGTAASFNNPAGVAVDAAGNVYVADDYNSSVRKITSVGVVTTLVGNGTYGVVDGPVATAGFGNVQNIAIDGAGNLYVNDTYNRIRKISTTGVVSTFAGNSTYGTADGTGGAASFSTIDAMVADKFGNLYVADGSLIRRINANGVVNTIAGTANQGFANGVGTAASFDYPYGLSIDGSGNMYASDGSNNVIRKIVLTRIWYHSYATNWLKHRRADRYYQRNTGIVKPCYNLYGSGL